jgi:hypothetical protein
MLYVLMVPAHMPLLQQVCTPLCYYPPTPSSSQAAAANAQTSCNQEDGNMQLLARVRTNLLWAAQLEHMHDSVLTAVCPTLSCGMQQLLGQMAGVGENSMCRMGNDSV